MPTARSGHHGNIVYVFEDQGFDTAPNDTTYKVFGSNVTPPSFNGTKQAERIFNNDRRAANIIRQNFEGTFEVSFNISEPPWWLAGLYGQPDSTEVSAPLYDYVYDLDNNNDPVSLRIYMATDGFSDYEYLSGCVLLDCSVDQSNDASPDVTANFAYAKEPQRSSSLSLSVPSFGENTYSNRDAELKVDGTSVGIVQDTSLNIQGNQRMVQGYGTGNATSFVPGTWEPDVNWSKIIDTGQSVDPLNRFKNANQVNVKLLYDNGETGSDEYSIDFDVQGSFPSEWSESGRNDPESNLEEEIQELGDDCVVTVTTDAGSSGNPPGITL